MPLCTLHLLSLHATTPNPLQTFLSTLQKSNISPLVISRVIRWIILPTTLSTERLLARNIPWDILLILPSADTTLPSSLENLVKDHWSVTAGVPSRLTQSFHEKNNKLLHPDAGTVPKLSTGNSKKTTDSSQHLELSGELNEWIDAFVQSGGKAGKGAVSMFNLLAFKPGMKSEYLKYGAAFASSIGSAHGGNAKIVGNVTAVNGVTKPPTTTTTTPTEKQVGIADAGGVVNRRGKEDGGAGGAGGVGIADGAGVVNKSAGGGDWDEIALAHYPSIQHFRDMLASEEYQRVNQRHRVPSLRDTCILMTSEILVEELLGGGAKL